MINYQEITPEHWELFTRDFLNEMGFTIEISPDRGPDGGKDILIRENVKGTIYKGHIKWLVSCKQFAKSGKAVSEGDEPNIIERLSSFKAQGFMGIYSTLPSSGLNSRLRQLKEQEKIADYRIFDGKLIENYLVTVGYSELLLRYFPLSYKAIRPLHQIVNEYLPLKCDCCGKDLLRALFTESYQANFVRCGNLNDGKLYIEDVYCACKGECDRKLKAGAIEKGFSYNGWHDISDLVIPVEYLRCIFSITNQIKDGRTIYNREESYEKERKIFLSLAQKVLRFTTEEEKKRVKDIITCFSMG